MPQDVDLGDVRQVVQAIEADDGRVSSAKTPDTAAADVPLRLDFPCALIDVMQDPWSRKIPLRDDTDGQASKDQPRGHGKRPLHWPAR
jgi:hypothetical protein